MRKLLQLVSCQLKVDKNLELSNKVHELIDATFQECVRCRDLVADAMSEMMRAQIGPGISSMESTSFSPVFSSAGTGGFHPSSTTNFQGILDYLSKDFPKENTFDSLREVMMT